MSVALRSRGVVTILALFIALSACAVHDNLQDGYQPGDVADGMIENRQLYCSAPYRGIRAIGRMLVTFLGGVTVPNPCAIIDAVVSEHNESA